MLLKKYLSFANKMLTGILYSILLCPIFLFLKSCLSLSAPFSPNVITYTWQKLRLPEKFSFLWSNYLLLKNKINITITARPWNLHISSCCFVKITEQTLLLIYIKSEVCFHFVNQHEIIFLKCRVKDQRKFAFYITALKSSKEASFMQKQNKTTSDHFQAVNDLSFLNIPKYWLLSEFKSNAREWLSSLLYLNYHFQSQTYGYFH